MRTGEGRYIEHLIRGLDEKKKKKDTVLIGTKRIPKPKIFGFVPSETKGKMKYNIVRDSSVQVSRI